MQQMQQSQMESVYQLYLSHKDRESVSLYTLIVNDPIASKLFKIYDLSRVAAPAGTRGSPILVFPDNKSFVTGKDTRQCVLHIITRYTTQLKATVAASGGGDPYRQYAQQPQYRQYQQQQPQQTQYQPQQTQYQPQQNQYQPQQQQNQYQQQQRPSQQAQQQQQNQYPEINAHPEAIRALIDMGVDVALHASSPAFTRPGCAEIVPGTGGSSLDNTPPAFAYDDTGEFIRVSEMLMPPFQFIDGRRNETFFVDLNDPKYELERRERDRIYEEKSKEFSKGQKYAVPSSYTPPVIRTSRDSTLR